MRTDKQLAPPRWYAWAKAVGSKSARIWPFDGEAFLISAIRPKPSDSTACRRAFENPRAGKAVLAAASTSTKGRDTCRALICSRLSVQIRSRISLTGVSLSYRWGRAVGDLYQLLQFLFGMTIVDRPGCQLHAVREICSLAGNHQGGCCVEQHHVPI